MSIEDFLSDPSQGMDTEDWTDFTDYNTELAQAIDARITNDEWRLNRKQQYYVTHVIEQTLEDLPNNPDQRQIEVPNVRTKVQKELADDVDVKKPTIQQACHQNLFKSDEDPPKEYKKDPGRTSWYELFDQLIRELDRTWYQTEEN